MNSGWNGTRWTMTSGTGASSGILAWMRGLDGCILRPSRGLDTLMSSRPASQSLRIALQFSGMNFSNFNLSRALSSFDVTHNFVASYGYEFPFDRLVPVAPKR